MPNYERYWDIHMSAGNGFYDFAGQIQDQINYQTNAHKDKLRNSKNYVSVPANCIQKAIITPMSSSGASKTHAGTTGGVIATAIKITDLAGEVCNDEYKEMVEWVSSTDHVGKIRLNAHGLAGGKIYMSESEDPNKTYQMIYAGAFARWLFINGLKKPVHKYFHSKASKGVTTINLNLCYSAETSKENGNKIMSSVERVAGVMGAIGYSGIEVTGISFTAATLPSTSLVSKLKADGYDVSNVTQTYGDITEGGRSGFMKAGKWFRLAHSEEKVSVVSSYWYPPSKNDAAKM